MTTRIDSSQVGISNGDYKVNELSEVVAMYLRDVAAEAIKLASDRRKWIAFTPSVANANALCLNLHNAGIRSAVVCGETPKDDRERLIAQFKRGEIRCLVTVLALSVGFDVPDVDCIVWCRPTKSPVLYVQGMGRGVRIADGKSDCLVLDFTDTVERLGPVDTIKGRAKTKGGKSEAPFVICDDCGARNHATAMICAECGATIREADTEKKEAKVSIAALLSTPAQKPVVTWHDITRVAYAIHQKEGKPDSLRVDYYAGYLRVASEWVCVFHGSFATQKAQTWIDKRTPDIDYRKHLICLEDKTIMDIKDSSAGNWFLQDWIDQFSNEMAVPTRIATRQNGKYTEIVGQSFEPMEQPA